MNKTVTRYSEFPDRASYHGKKLSFNQWLKKFILSFKSGIVLGKQVRICKKVEIKLTKNAILKIGDSTIIGDYSFIQLTKPNPSLIIGRNSFIGRNCIIACKSNINIGSFVLIGPYCQINDHQHGTSKDNLIINQKAILEPVNIGDDVWIGSGVRILSGVSIGEGAVIGAGSVVTKNIPPYEIWAGNPARFIKIRE